MLLCRELAHDQSSSLAFTGHRGSPRIGSFTIVVNGHRPGKGAARPEESREPRFGGWLPFWLPLTYSVVERGANHALTWAVVRPSGFEPETCGLRVRCSAVELEAHRRV